jgi:hypothetical protein
MDGSPARVHVGCMVFGPWTTSPAPTHVCFPESQPPPPPPLHLCCGQAPLPSGSDGDVVVMGFVDGVLARLPAGFTIPEVTSLLERSGGLGRPLHAFLLQETQVRCWLN